ncbi:MAG: DUF503 domain-containing protein [Firmicutes bacterium]|nr:DUF503 domain-containing protein [Bacillota bacterium]
MIIGSCEVYLSAEWVKSLKEKRMVVKSLVEKTKNKFNVSVAEVDKQDILQSIVIGFACVSNEKKHAQSIIDNVIDYMEKNTDAVIDDIVTEIF